MGVTGHRCRTIKPCQEAMMTVAASDRILQLGMGFRESKVLLSAVELRVFTVLAEAPTDLARLSTRLNLHERSAKDFLDSLVALDLLERVDGVYRNTAESDLFLDQAKPSYVGGLLDMANARLYRFWGSLTEALRTGEPQNEIKRGEDLFEAVYADSRALSEFLAAMSGISVGPAAALVSRFDWHARKTFADIGSAQGLVPVTLAKAHPHLRGVGFDLPAVRPIFDEFVTRHSLSGQISFQAGDFFSDELPTAEVLILGQILHDWDVSQRMVLLQKSYDTLPKGGALIVYDQFVDDERRWNTPALLASLNMLIETRGGSEYTGRQCREWMEQVGFTDIRIEPMVGSHSLAIGTK
jgi:hypothetical protein